MKSFHSNHRIRLIAAMLVVAVIGTLTTTADALPSTLEDLINNNTQVIVGNVKLDEFSYIKTGDMPDAADITVLAHQDGNGHYGVRFEGDFKDLAGGGFSDGLITFRVMGIDFPLTDAHLSVVPEIVGGPGFVAVAETFLPDEPQLFMSAFDEEPGPEMLSDWVDFTQPRWMIEVQKDIFADARGAQGSAGFTRIDQTFSIPEPASAMLLLGGLALIARRRQRA